jgi:hypothetical protein
LLKACLGEKKDGKRYRSVCLLHDIEDCEHRETCRNCTLCVEQIFSFTSFGVFEVEQPSLRLPHLKWWQGLSPGLVSVDEFYTAFIRKSSQWGSEGEAVSNNNGPQAASRLWAKF